MASIAGTFHESGGGVYLEEATWDGREEKLERFVSPSIPFESSLSIWCRYLATKKQFGLRPQFTELIMLCKPCRWGKKSFGPRLTGVSGCFTGSRTGTRAAWLTPPAPPLPSPSLPPLSSHSSPSRTSSHAQHFLLLSDFIIHCVLMRITHPPKPTTITQS